MLYNKIFPPRSKGYTKIRRVKDMSEAKKYDRSYKEQSVKPALETGVKRTSEELKVQYGTAVRVGAGGKERRPRH